MESEFVDGTDVPKSGRAPDFIAREGVMIWVNKDRNGKPYLSVKIPLLNVNVNAFSTDKDGAVRAFEKKSSPPLGDL